jgi:hypothetical protein
MRIESGQGNGFEAGVNAQHELLTHARTVSHAAHEAQNEARLFFLATDIIALTTTASFSALVYLKNTSSTHNLFLHRIRTCGSVVHQWRMIAQPTTGTIVDDATDITETNTNFASSLTLDANAYKGADAKTITDGALMSQWIGNVGFVFEKFDGEIILGPNDAIALECKPASSGDVAAVLVVGQEKILNGS